MEDSCEERSREGIMEWTETDYDKDARPLFHMDSSWTDEGHDKNESFSEEEENQVLPVVPALTHVHKKKQPAHVYSPHELVGYVHLTFIACAAFIVLCVMCKCISIVWSDINIRVERRVVESMLEIDLCKKNYMDNMCYGVPLVPAMEPLCKKWKICMEKDPRNVGMAKISAETFADILNGFVEPISLRTLLFISILTILLLITSSSLLSLAKLRFMYKNTKQTRKRQHLLTE